ncbi:p21-ras protein [Wallemia mellicola CBS 633.66]|uniref:p21-ras protein n=1 Tax=Wallemia mellicola (strain ATCC MYA-4683 / CBS 633.66) TaxID=671144 RepID=I4Y5P5_WALMC|nr:p21-ras protein [Wallemia mellicola CBS 633.66]EIM19287.1 p21-ras protein [Wallemia mellicola CBS 633.66]|eukprot:XP_006960680.1 p21-ras protein [Wallemia mellicola CBS 633.66]
MRSIRICVLGAGAVGKSSITVRFVHGSFYENYDPTIEDSFTKLAEIDGKTHRLQITDTAGVEQMMTLRESVIRESHAFLLVFALDNPSTFNDLLPIVEDIKRIKDTDGIRRIPVLLCGNKVDLGFERVFPSNFQPSGVFKGVKYLETSAKLKIGIEEAFLDLAKIYMDQRRVRRERHKQLHRHDKRDKCVLM